jgi:hypothetical protein
VASVPRFFFHTHDGSTILDDEGTELVDVKAARDEAITACEMLREVPAIIEAGGAWRLWVTDEPDGKGTTQFTLTIVAQNH